jgi:hypothetical protein
VGKPIRAGPPEKVPAWPLAPASVGVPDNVTPAPRSAVAKAVAFVETTTVMPFAAALGFILALAVGRRLLTTAGESAAAVPEINVADTRTAINAAPCFLLKSKRVN